MNTEKTPLARLVPNQDNPRKITDGNFELLVRSILSFPSMLELRPVIIDQQMNILGGNRCEEGIVGKECRSRWTLEE